MRDHGYARYRLDGCRCYTCGWARAEYDDRRNRLMAEGSWEPFVDIEETRFRVFSLADLGMGDRSIAELAGLGRKVIRDIRLGYRADPSRGNPTLTKIRRETAAAILAIPYDPLGAKDGVLVDSTRTWQRVDALLEAGYSQRWVARGIGSQAVDPALQIRRGHPVTARNARAVRDLFDRVAMQAGPNGKTPYDMLEDKIEEYAVAEKIDVDEVAVYRRMHGDTSVRLNTQERDMLITLMNEQGLNDGEIGMRTGYHKDSIGRRRVDLGLPSRYDPGVGRTYRKQAYVGA